MKRCPDCRRDFYDDTLLYCLDDGARLLEGPPSGESQTVMLPDSSHLDSSRTISNVDTAVYSPATSNGRKRSVLIVGSVLIAALFGIGFAIYRYAKEKPPVTFQSANLTKMTSTGKVGGVALSPDGKYIAHIQAEGGNQSLWVRQTATTSNVQLIPPAKVAYRGLTFTPDSNYIYYSVGETRDQQGTLYQIPTLGGTPRKILSGIANSATFSPDKKQMAFFRTTSVDGGREDALIVANADGSDERVVAMKRGDERLHRGAFGTPSWSPDGKSVACPHGSYIENLMTVSVASLDTGEIRNVTSQKWFAVRQVAWLDNDRILLNGSLHATSPYQIWQVGVATGDVHRVTNDLLSYRQFSLSPESKSVAVLQATGSANLVVIPPVDPGRPVEITHGQNFNVSVSWSPDGRLAYASDAAGAIDIFLKDPWIGGAAKQLTAEAGTNNFPRVSPDGRYIVFMSDRKGRPNIWRMDLDGGNLKQLTDGYDLYPDVSPDSRWVVYQSWVDGKNVLKKVGIEGGNPIQLTDYPAGRPSVSPDGKLIACTYTEDRTSPIHLAVVPFEGGAVLRTFPFEGFDGVESWSRIAWTEDGSQIVYARTADGVSNLVAQPLGGGVVKAITEPIPDRIFWFDFSRDGKQLVVSKGLVLSDVVLISGLN